MKRIAPAFAFVAAMLAAGPGEARKPGQVRDATNPSALVAAEIAFNRMAREEGHWTAFRKFADKDAVMFVPRPVNAADWLKGRDDPDQSVAWQPHQVWMSCDSTLGAVKGAWQRPDGSTGYFTTVWRRQKKGEYRWVMDQGDGLSEPLQTPDMVAGRIARCKPGAGPLPASPPPPGVELTGGHSQDWTLQWSVLVFPDGSRMIGVYLWNGGSFEQVVNLKVAAEAAG